MTDLVGKHGRHLQPFLETVMWLSLRTQGGMLRITAAQRAKASWNPPRRVCGTLQQTPPQPCLFDLYSVSPKQRRTRSRSSEDNTRPPCPFSLSLSLHHAAVRSVCSNGRLVAEVNVHTIDDVIFGSTADNLCFKQTSAAALIAGPVVPVPAPGRQRPPSGMYRASRCFLAQILPCRPVLIS